MKNLFQPIIAGRLDHNPVSRHPLVQPVVQELEQAVEQGAEQVVEQAVTYADGQAVADDLSCQIMYCTNDVRIDLKCQ